MARVLLTLVVLVLLPVRLLIAQQTNSPFDFLKTAYGKSRTAIASAHDAQRAEALAEYTRKLDAVMAGLKQKGDLDAFLLAQAEQKRLREERKVLGADAVPPALAAETTLYHDRIRLVGLAESAQAAKLLRQYITALDDLIRKSMMRDAIAEAKTVKEEKDKAALVLSDLEARLKEEAPAAAPDEPERLDEKKTAISPVERKAAAKREARERAKAFQMHRYLLVEEARTWPEAKAACDAIGGRLVTIGSKAENDFVKSLAGGRGLWLGITDEGREGKYAWVDGLPVRFSNWVSGEPSNGSGNEHYGAFMQSYNGYGWYIEDGSQQNSFICEWDY